MRQDYAFAPDFLWGASSSAYQCEGAAAEDGKAPNVQDVKTVPAGTADFTVASDHYHRYKEDIALLAEMKARAYRFSVSWARILPNGKENAAGIAHYHDVIDTCLHYGIAPIVTMYHFDLPAALEAQGGWNNPATIDAYVAFARVLFREYGDKVPYFLTINEQNVMILAGTVVGTGGAGQSAKQLYQKNHNMMLAQAKVMILCHEMAPSAKIGPAPNINVVYPASSRPEDYLASREAEAMRNWLYLDLAVLGRYNTYAWDILRKQDSLPEIAPGDMDILANGKPDFISLNYYATMTAEAAAPAASDSVTADQQSGFGMDSFRAVKNPHLPKTPFGWSIDPLGFTTVLKEVYDRYRLPIMISENGIGLYETLEADGSVHDTERIRYYEAHISALARAVESGVPVFAYCPWSAMDLISTHEGFRKRYGFIYVNRTDESVLDLARYKKDSFYWYRSMIQNRGRF